MKASLKKDVVSICGGLYSLNAPNAIGYLFNPTIDEKEISTGMLCNSESEINKDEWTYFFDFRTKKFKTIR